MAGTKKFATLLGIAPADVTDLVPVEPLIEMEPHVTELYRTRLQAIYEKIKP